MAQGPNMKCLIVAKMSRDAIPEDGGIEAGLRFLLSAELIKKGAQTATEWSNKVIRLVREAGEPNPWKSASDEDIAAEILRRMMSERQP